MIRATQIFLYSNAVRCYSCTTRAFHWRKITLSFASGYGGAITIAWIQFSIRISITDTQCRVVKFCGLNISFKQYDSVWFFYLQLNILIKKGREFYKYIIIKKITMSVLRYFDFHLISGLHNIVLSWLQQYLLTANKGYCV